LERFLEAIRSVSSRVLERSLFKEVLSMTIKARTLSASLLVLLTTRTFELSLGGPPDEPVPSEDVDEPSEDGGDDGTPEGDAAFSIDWTEVVDAPLARFEGQSTVVDGKLYVFGGYTDGSPL
jgi:hypothetical protein